ncbi:MAG: hypothetical protein SAK42_06250 [Oscillatoria sp. PMC 1076.18]|nr:hypothetical protein [Oscillatoria sp. PMC 1076.18]
MRLKEVKVRLSGIALGSLTALIAANFPAIASEMTSWENQSSQSREFLSEVNVSPEETPAVAEEKSVTPLDAVLVTELSPESTTKVSNITSKNNNFSNQDLALENSAKEITQTKSEVIEFGQEIPKETTATQPVERITIGQVAQTTFLEIPARETTPATVNQATEINTVNSRGEVEIQAQTVSQEITNEPAQNSTCAAQNENNQEVSNQGIQLAQAARNCPRPQPITPLVIPNITFEEAGASPALSIYIPVGFGADGGTLFVSGTYQASVRENDGDLATFGAGLGLGNARDAVGVELSYAFETEDSDDFGAGGFNAKVHRQLGRDLSVAVGWNGFANIGDNDFDHSVYGVATTILRTRESINDPFSRVAFTLGVGTGQFSEHDDDDDDDGDGVNVFGNVAIRVNRPISFITEWSGDDLGFGLSIAPFKNIPFVITPAVRDVIGEGDEPRFVLGAGTAIKF